jgi:hypothetical protein
MNGALYLSLLLVRDTRLVDPAEVQSLCFSSLFLRNQPKTPFEARMIFEQNFISSGRIIYNWGCPSSF